MLILKIVITLYGIEIIGIDLVCYLIQFLEKPLLKIMKYHG